MSDKGKYQSSRFYRQKKTLLSRPTAKENDLPLVSIVTPCYNYGHFIEDTFRSVLGQSYPNIEYIVIDAGSTDNTLDLIKKYEPYGISQWISEPDNGQTDAINKGFYRSTGDIFAWINADDAYSHPDVIAEVVEEYQKGAQFISGEWEAWDGEGNLYPAGRKWGQSDPVTYEELLRFWEHICPPQPATFVDRKLAEKVFPLDSSVQCFMDFQLFLGVLAQKPKCYWTQKRWADFVYHGANKSLGNYANSFDEQRECEQVFLGSSKCLLSANKQKVYQKMFESYFLVRAAIQNKNRKIILTRYLQTPSFFHNSVGLKHLAKALFGFGLYGRTKQVLLRISK